MTRSHFALVLLALVGLASASAQTPRVQVDTSSVLLTSGTGTVTLAPDRAILIFTVSTQDSTARGAAARNGTRIKRVVDSLTALRLPGDTVDLVGVSVSPNENYERGITVNYEAWGSVRVTLQRLDQLAHTIDAAFASGATGIRDVLFHSNREDAARQEALARAYSQALTRARALASAAGADLGQLLRVSTEPSAGFPYSLAAGANPIDASRGYGLTAISPQDIPVTATVYTTWRLIPKN